MPFHAGLDWGATLHAICVIDERGAVLERLECPPPAAGLTELLTRLKCLAPPAELPIAIERPSGLVVDMLTTAGHPVVPIHPNVVKACRPRYRAADGKSDPGDAYLRADILRTNGHHFAPLRAVCNDIKALRAPRPGIAPGLIRGAGTVYRRLRAAVTCWDGNSRHACAWAAQRYARARGCDHPYAVRILARAWFRVLWKAWIGYKPYDLKLHARALACAA